jgi:hypothetical protein
MPLVPYVFTFRPQPAISRSRYDLPTVLLDSGDISRPRQSQIDSEIVRGFDNQLKPVAAAADWVHSIDSAADVGQLVTVTTGRYASAGLRQINGQAVELADVVEVPSVVARAFVPPIAPGRYKVVDVNTASASIQNINPVQYALSSATEIGGAIYYRADPNNPGGLEGLNKTAWGLEGTAIQTRPGTDVSNPAAMFDGNPNTLAEANSASWQGVKGNLPTLAVEGLEFRFGARRYSYDTQAMNAAFLLKFYAGKDQTGSSFDIANNNAVRDAATLSVHSGSVWANSSSAPRWYYWRGKATIGSFRLDDDSGSRAGIYEITPIVAGGNSQIKLANGVVPEIGSILNVSPDVGKSFFPPIAPGAYTVLKNDGAGPWRLGAPMKLISPIGAALVWALYVGDTNYDESSTDTIIFEVGTAYELRINAPEKITTVEYRSTFPGLGDEVFTVTSVGANFAQNWRPTISQLEVKTGSITVTAGTWTKTYPIKVQYTQRGAIRLETGGSYKAGATFAVDITSDPLRSYTRTDVEVFDSAGVSVIPLFSTTGKSFSLTFPAIGTNYQLKAEIVYGDSLRPNEIYNVRFNTNG